MARPAAGGSAAPTTATQSLSARARCLSSGPAESRLRSSLPTLNCRSTSGGVDAACVACLEGRRRSRTLGSRWR
eukprot:2943021-Rhodomonas_salina.3